MDDHTLQELQATVDKVKVLRENKTLETMTDHQARDQIITDYKNKIFTLINRAGKNDAK